MQVESAEATGRERKARMMTRINKLAGWLA